MEKILHTLSELIQMILSVFGIPQLRPWQEEVLPEIFKGKDSFVMVPTGGGKSLVFQGPAMLEAGRALTLVISPTRTLQVDQVEALKNKGLPAALINSDLQPSGRRYILEHLKDYALLYCAPEQLRAKDLRTALEQVTLARVVIDEAHILAEAKFSFRPAYGEIGKFIQSCSPRPQVIALTATATPKARKQIRKDLGLKQDAVEFVYPVRKPNLEIQVKRIKANKQKSLPADAVMLNALEAALKQWDGKGSVIIYGATVKQVNNTYKWLKGRRFKVRKITGKTGAKKRRENQQAFMNGDAPIMVATNAFGLGIDKRDVRLVIHMGLPLTLEGYVQEIGRAGRDGKTSKCILFYTKDNYKRNKRILESGGKEASEWSLPGLESMLRFAQDKKKCAWKKIEKHFGEKPGKRCRCCSNCVAKKLIK